MRQKGMERERSSDKVSIKEELRRKAHSGYFN